MALVGNSLFRDSIFTDLLFFEPMGLVDKDDEMFPPYRKGVFGLEYMEIRLESSHIAHAEGGFVFVVLVRELGGDRIAMAGLDAPFSSFRPHAR